MPPKRKAASAASEAITSIQTPITRSTRSKSDAAAKKAKIEEPTVTLLQEGDQLPDDLPPVTTDKGAEVRVQDLAKESGLLIFFYPRANTPGCTTQACGFRDRYSDLVAEGWKVYGMSYDTPKAQTTWKQKYSLQYDLLCDPQGQVLKRLGVTKTLSGNGGGVKRSHVVIEKGGRIKSLKIGVSPAQSISQGIESMTGKAVPDSAEALGTTNGAETTQVSEPTNTVPISASVPAVADTTPLPSMHAEVTETPIGNTEAPSQEPIAAAAANTETVASALPDLPVKVAAASTDDLDLPSITPLPAEPAIDAELQGQIAELPVAPIAPFDPVATGMAPVTADLSSAFTASDVPLTSLDPTPVEVSAQVTSTESLGSAQDTSTEQPAHDQNPDQTPLTTPGGLQPQL